MLRISLSTIICMVSLLPVSGQTDSFPSANASRPGAVNIIQDERIGLLLQTHIESNEKRGGIPGYRIRIFSQSGQSARQNANAVRAQFLNRYPDVEGYLSYDAPNFKVYVGDFRTRSEALRFYNRLIHDFPNAFIISDIITLPRD
jgi:hypothetical protein